MSTLPSPHFVRLSPARGILALSPLIIFLLLYLVVSLVIGDFYKMPLAVALTVSSMWAICLMKGVPLVKRIEIFSRQAAGSDVMYMVWIFILAGAFAMLARQIGAVEATVNLALDMLPVELLVPGLFAAACFISLAIGTSVGTVVALTPLAAQLAETEGGNIPFFVAVVLGGAFFGDNLSFISDTTIAATRTQGCRMNEKFRANFIIVFPAAVCALILYYMIGADSPVISEHGDADPWLVVPYMVVIVTALIGINVTLVLSLGIISAMALGLCYGHTLVDMCSFMGEGMDSVGNLIIVTLLASGMLGLIKKAGGIDFMLSILTKGIHGRRGAKLSLALLVGVVNLCTANNTVAILTVGSMSRSIASAYGIAPRKAASILDTCSCIVQSLIPYGAQALLAASLSGISPVAPWPYMYYSWMLALAVGVGILIDRGHRRGTVVTD